MSQNGVCTYFKEVERVWRSFHSLPLCAEHVIRWSEFLRSQSRILEEYWIFWRLECLKSLETKSVVFLVFWCLKSMKVEFFSGLGVWKAWKLSFFSEKLARESKFLKSSRSRVLFFKIESLSGVFRCLKSVRQLFFGRNPDFAANNRSLFRETEFLFVLNDWKTVRQPYITHKISFLLLLVFVERYERLFENGTPVVLD